MYARNIRSMYGELEYIGHLDEQDEVGNMDIHLTLRSERNQFHLQESRSKAGPNLLLF